MHSLNFYQIAEILNFKDFFGSLGSNLKMANADLKRQVILVSRSLNIIYVLVMRFYKLSLNGLMTCSSQGFSLCVCG